MPVTPTSSSAGPSGQMLSAGPNLTLGDVVFSEFEIPESLPLGGDHMLAEHKLPGGVRVIDAMGPDERDVEWSGRFRGANAQLRALRLDTLRAGGRQLTLTFSGFRRQVVIRRFHYDVQMAGLEIPYKLTLSVVINSNRPLLATPPSVDQALAADMAAMQALGLAEANVLTQLRAVATAYAAYQSVRAGNYTAIGALIGAAAAGATAAGPSSALMGSLLGLSNSVTAAIAVTAPLLQATALPGGGMAALASAATLAMSSLAFQQMAQLLALQSLTNRAATNLGNQIDGDGGWNGPAVMAAAS